jgi:hypothetical protein
VFRAVAGAHASYFSGDSGEALAGAIQDWLRLHEAGQTPASTGISSRTWSDNAAELMDILFP